MSFHLNFGAYFTENFFLINSMEQEISILLIKLMFLMFLFLRSSFRIKIPLSQLKCILNIFVASVFHVQSWKK